MLKTLTKWLNNKDYECFYNFPLGGKFPDLIAIRNKELIAFELKKHVGEITTAMGQCLFYLNNANQVYIVLPKEEENLIANTVIETLKEQGIGLIVCNNDVKILAEAKKFSKDNTSVIEDIKKIKASESKEIKLKINLKNKIIETLKEHPEGLTTVDISKLLRISRNTASKYIYQLLGEGSVIQREIGNAKLCYLKKMIK